MRKLSFDEVNNFIQLKGYRLLDNKYTNGRKKLTLQCEKGYYYTITFENFKQGKIPRMVSVNNEFTITNIRLWCKLNNKSFILLSEEYKNPVEPMEWKCLKDECKETFIMDWNHASNGRGCGYCHGKQVGKSNCLANVNPELTKEWNFDKNEKSPYDYTKSSNNTVWWKCIQCNYEWEARIAHRNNGIGCPQCSESKGEKRIRDWLDEYNYEFIPQKEFDGLIGIGFKLLSYDFYIPIKNILIEYQGEFHDGNGNYYIKENLEKQQEHDKRKREYAKKHNIELLEIWYWDFDNIEEILIREFKEMIN